jgi:hypothetical protein
MCYKCENTVEKLSARSLPGSYLRSVAPSASGGKPVSEREISVTCL